MKAYFGLRCFWGPEAKFGSIKQIEKTSVGYAGGTKKNPTYRSLGDHTEVVRLEYNGDYRELLDNFWDWHDYSRKMKKQYQSLILTVNKEQQVLAKTTKPDSASTKIKKLESFYLAEDYHQKYRLRNSKYFKIFEKYTESEILQSEKAARYNAVAAGHITEKQAAKLLDKK